MFTICNSKRLILASSSPRRKNLLSSTGLDFSISKPEIEEPEPSSGENGLFFARRCCVLKGEACAKNAHRQDIILAADTIVCLNNKIFGKPKDTFQAFQMLRNLNGVTHEVITAFCLLYTQESQHIRIVNHDISKVTLANWPDEVLYEYAQTGESLDKAGSYAIQEKGAFLVESITGSWSNVVGLPLSSVIKTMLENDLISPKNHL